MHETDKHSRPTAQSLHPLPAGVTPFAIVESMCTQHTYMFPPDRRV
jgi:hypothetical protein